MRPAGSNEKPVATSPRGCETLNNGTDWARGEPYTSDRFQRNGVGVGEVGNRPTNQGAAWRDFDAFIIKSSFNQRIGRSRNNSPNSTRRRNYSKKPNGGNSTAPKGKKDVTASSTVKPCSKPTRPSSKPHTNTSKTSGNTCARASPNKSSRRRIGTQTSQEKQRQAA